MEDSSEPTLGAKLLLGFFVSSFFGSSEKTNQFNQTSLIVQPGSASSSATQCNSSSKQCSGFEVQLKSKLTALGSAE